VEDEEAKLLSVTKRKRKRSRRHGRARRETGEEWVGAGRDWEGGGEGMRKYKR